MSHAVRSAVTGSSPPATATISHFDCLFTHDLRRKQKRWQDGKLSFHTFNKRYMVYDDRGSFVGDGHWPGDVDEFNEGLELNLDRGLAIVQVDQYKGSTEQDLTEILDKRARDVEKRRAEAAAKTPNPHVRSTRPGSLAGAGHLLQTAQHRPLSGLVSNDGPLGRAAISQRSPYEVRRNLRLAEGEERNPIQPSTSERRPRVSPPPSKMGHAQSLFGTRLTLTTGSVPLNTIGRKALRLERPPQAKRSNAEFQDEEAQEGERSSSHTALSRGKVQDMSPFFIPQKRVMNEADDRRKLQKEEEEEEEEEDDKEDDSEQEADEEEVKEKGEVNESPEAILLEATIERNPKPPTSRTQSRRPLQGKAKASGDTITVPTSTSICNDEIRPSPTSKHHALEEVDHNASLQVKKTRTQRGQSTKSADCKEKRVANGFEEHSDGTKEKRKEKKGNKKQSDQKDLGGDQRAAMQEEAAEGLVDDIPRYQSTERRTQLRSKSRPKRGLLILSEERCHDAGQPIPETSRPDREDDCEATRHNEGPSPGASGETESDSMPSKAPKRRRAKVDEQEASGPHVKRMARKSVKSKEIFGLAAPLIDLSAAPFMSTTHPAPNTESSDETQSKGAQKQKITNPATRGRKAARKEHAAGLAPQSVVPFEPVIVSSRSVHSADRTFGPDADAGGIGGAWSRHAGDLLGMTRPAK